MFLLSLYDTTASVSVQQQETLQVFLFYIGKDGYFFFKMHFFFAFCIYFHFLISQSNIFNAKVV